MTAPPAFPKNPQLIPYLYILNRLVLKTAAVKTKEALIFLIVNDTFHLLKFDRAILFHISPKKTKVLGISGQPSINSVSPLVNKLEKIASGLKHPQTEAFLDDSHFKENTVAVWKEVQAQTHSAVLWLPIFSDNQLVLGLWLERWDTQHFTFPTEDFPELLKNFLLPAFGVAWTRFNAGFSFKKWLGISAFKLMLLSTLLLIASLAIQVPLRIVAPCEIVASDPYVVRAPLEGVVQGIVVKPGQWVKKGDVLLEYDRKILEDALKSTQKEALAKQLEVERASFLGLQDKKFLDELALLKVKQQKELVNLGFMEYQVGLLTVIALEEGFIQVDAPDEWLGRPVKKGEKILVINNPQNTKIQMMIPESDNIPLDLQAPIKIFLNTDPFKSYLAEMEYIANEVSISDQKIPSFLAKANWIDQPPHLKLGLKGTAILYGEKVPLLYYILRKPWNTLRQFTGL